MFISIVLQAIIYSAAPSIMVAQMLLSIVTLYIYIYIEKLGRKYHPKTSLKFQSNPKPFQQVSTI